MKIVYGDLLEATEDIIIHGCNSRGAFGSGIAKQIRYKHNNVYQTYKQYYEKHGLKLGEVIWAFTDGKLFGNAITQQNYGNDGRQYADYDAIRNCLIETKKVATMTNYTIALPQIGCGLGGCDWNKVKDIIEEILPESTIYIKGD